MNRQTMHIIHLHGSLAEFGESYRLAVNTPLEAIRALSFQIKGFAEAMQTGMFRIVRGQNADTGMHYEVPFDAKKNEYDISMLHFSLGASGNDVHIVPVISGAGGNGTGKIIIGAVIMVAAVVAAPFTGGTSLAGGISAFSFGVGGATAFAFGAALVLSGVGMMLQPSVKPSYSSNESPDQRASFFLGGQVNQNSQGGPVVLAYGKCRIGSTVISAGLSAERI